MLSKSLIITGILCLLVNAAAAQSAPQCKNLSSAQAQNRILVQNAYLTADIDRGPLGKDYVGGRGVLGLGDYSFHRIEMNIWVSAKRGWFGRTPGRETVEFKNYECKSPLDLKGTYIWDKAAQAFRNEKGVQLIPTKEDSGLAQVNEIEITLSYVNDMVAMSDFSTSYGDLVLTSDFDNSPGLDVKNSSKLLRGLGPTEKQREKLMALPAEKSIEILLNSLSGNSDTRAALLLAQLFDAIAVDHEFELRRSFETMDSRKERALNLLIAMSLTPSNYHDLQDARKAAARVLRQTMNAQTSAYILEGVYNVLSIEKDPRIVQVNNAVYLVLTMDKEVDLREPQYQSVKKLLALLNRYLNETLQETRTQVHQAGLRGEHNNYQIQSKIAEKLETLSQETLKLTARL